MKKRRATVYVRPGKDVTLYIPTDTPTEVIDYLNGLKREGFFSQGVMEIVTSYIREGRSHPFQADVESEAAASFLEDAPALLQAPEPNKDDRLQLAQIFKQARHNSGKLMDSRDD